MNFKKIFSLVLALLAMTALCGCNILEMGTAPTLPKLHYDESTLTGKVEFVNGRTCRISILEGDGHYDAATEKREADVIFVGWPIWCGTMPMPLYTFLEHYDWTGKKIVPLCTNEGSGLAKSPADLERICTGATVLPGLAVFGHQVQDSRQQIADWAKAQI